MRPKESQAQRVRKGVLFLENVVQFTWLDKLVYHIKEDSAYQDSNGDLHIAPMCKATFRDVVFAFAKLLCVLVGLAFWIPGMLGFFFIGPFTWVHTAIYVASLFALGFVINNWEVEYVQDYQRKHG